MVGSDGSIGGIVRRWAPRAPLAIPIVAVLVLGWHQRWMTDDGFIYLRIVDQVQAGNGPVFNAGERVEAYTSPAWLAILVVADLGLPLQLEWIAVLLGLGLSAFGLAAAMAGSIRLARCSGPPDRSSSSVLLPAGALVLIAPIASWAWWTSGLETGLVWGWLGACLLVLARWASSDQRATAGTCVLVGLGWLIRPELVLLSGLFVIVLLLGAPPQTTWRGRARVVGLCIAIPLAYQVFRMGYFGLLVANTAVAKEGSTFVWSRGVDYLRDFVDTYWLWLPVLIVALAGVVPLARRGTRRSQLVIGAFVIGGLVLGLQVVAVGGDYFHGRMFVPALFALCAPVAAVPLERRFAGLVLLVPWVLVTAVLLRPPPPAVLSMRPILPKEAGLVTAEQKGWTRAAAERARAQGTISLATAPFNPTRLTTSELRPAGDVEPPVVAATAIGLLGYGLGPDVRVIDVLGLSDPFGSHLETLPDRSLRAGHEKPLPESWFVGRYVDPDVEVPGSVVAPLIGGGARLTPLRSGAEFQDQVAAARAARACAPIANLDDAATGDFGPRRFLQSLLRAPANTSLRIPADPQDALEELCS